MSLHIRRDQFPKYTTQATLLNNISLSKSSLFLYRPGKRKLAKLTSTAYFEQSKIVRDIAYIPNGTLLRISDSFFLFFTSPLTAQLSEVILKPVILSVNNPC